MPRRKIIVIIYLLIIVSAAGFCYVHIGKDLLPKTNNGQIAIATARATGYKTGSNRAGNQRMY